MVSGEMESSWGCSAKLAAKHIGDLKGRNQSVLCYNIEGNYLGYSNSVHRSRRCSSTADGSP